MKSPKKELLKKILIAAGIVVLFVLVIILLRGAENLFDGFRSGLSDLYLN